MTVKSEDDTKSGENEDQEQTFVFVANYSRINGFFLPRFIIKLSLHLHYNHAPKST
jgi:hypothetical protein